MSITLNCLFQDKENWYNQFGINATGYISELFCIISHAKKQVKCERNLNYHKWCSFQRSAINHAIIVYTST